MKYGRMYRIYCYTNKINGKKYIGQTCQTLEERAGKDGKRYSRNPVFGPAIRTHGWSNFVPEILEDGLTLEEANEREQYWIRELNTLTPFGYNVSKGGDNRECHELTRKKLSENNARVWKGIPVSEERKERISNGLKGNKNHLGKNLTSEQKKHQQEVSSSKRAVCQYTLDGEFVAEYPSLKEAERQTGIYNGHISKCCRGKGSCKSLGGYLWRFSDDPIEDGIKYERSYSCHFSVCQYSKSGQFIKEYFSISEANRETGIDIKSISNCCKNKPKYKSAGGFIWRYKEVA